MKTIVYLLLPIVLFFLGTENNNSFESAATTTNNDVHLTMEGAWELINYYNYEDNKIIDSTNITEGYRQVKMYTANKVMWSRKVPLDSTEYFGYGSYVIEDGQLIETLEYGSAAMLRVLDTTRVFSFELFLSENRFTQIQIGPEGERIFSENFERID